jgi:hypothetical protein
MAATAPCDVLKTRTGRPNNTVPFKVPGLSSELRQAGYQNPNSGAFFEGLISVIRSEFIEGKEACERTGLNCGAAW